MSELHRSESGPLRKLANGLLVAMALVLPLVGLGYWWFADDAPAPSVSVVASPQGSTFQPAARELSELDRELLRAQRQTAALELVSPPGDNALETYLSIAQRHPEDRRAANALNELLPLAIDMAEAELARGNFAEAARIVELLMRAYPDSFRVPVLERRIAAAEAERMAEEARLAAERETDLQRRQLAEAQARAAAQRAEREAEALAAAQRAEAQARDQATRSPPASASETAQVAALPPPAPTAPPAGPPGDTPPAQRPQAAAAVETATEVAAAVAQGGGLSGARQFGVDDLRIVSETAPVYPPLALRRNIEGWVEVEFVVQPDGSVRDVVVVSADPRNVFDREAVRAVSRWRFEPYDPANAPGEGIRARKRLEFALNRAG